GRVPALAAGAAGAGAGGADAWTVAADGAVAVADGAVAVAGPGPACCGVAAVAAGGAPRPASIWPEARSSSSRREVAAADAAAWSGGFATDAATAGPAAAVGADAAPADGAGAPARAEAAASCAIASGWPSPGHSITRRVPSGPLSKRGLSATTGLARSKTMRVVPATGWPARTPLTTPAAGGRAREPAARLSGRSITSRSGFCRLIRLNSASRSTWTSARVPVGPLPSRTPRTSAACARFQTSAASRARPSRICCSGSPRARMGRSQSPMVRICNALSLANRPPANLSYGSGSAVWRKSRRAVQPGEPGAASGAACLEGGMAAVAGQRQPDVQVRRGQRARAAIRPFHQPQDRVGLVQAQEFEFAGSADPVQVQVQGLAAIGQAIALDQGVGRAAHGSGHAQRPQPGPGKRGF